MRMRQPQGYRTTKCKHNNKVRFHFRTLHRIKLEVEWPDCCDPKSADATLRAILEDTAEEEGEGDYRG